MGQRILASSPRRHHPQHQRLVRVRLRHHLHIGDRLGPGHEVSDFAGTGGIGGDDGAVAIATFDAPQGLAIDGAGAIYVTDVNRRTIRMIAEGKVSTIAGDGMAGFIDSDTPRAARFFGLEGLDVRDGRLNAADGYQGDNSFPYNRIRRLDLDKIE